MTRALENIRWVERFCVVPEGKNVGQPLKVAPFMRDDLKAIYDNPAGTRRAIISRARKNSKTTEAALILLLHLCGPEAKPNSQLYSAAQSRDQASLLFNLAAKMVRMNADLASVVIIRDTKKELYCRELGTIYRALSAEASTAYGLSPALIVHDEAGQIRGPRSELYEALETATAAQEDPLSIIISTQASTDADLLSILIDDAKQEHDPRTILRLQTADVDLDPFSEAAIRQANPAFDLFMNKAEVLAMAEDARRMPSRQAEFENLILNRRVERFNPFVSKSVWQSCGADPLPFDRSTPVYGGLDLSAVRDLTALVLVGWVDGKWQVHPTFWLPEDGLVEKARRDRVPYDLWRDQGFLRTAPGRSVDYEYVAEHLRSVFDRLNIVKIGFDRKFVEFLKPWLNRAGFSEADLETRFHSFGQGWVSMTPALRFLETEIANGRLAHGNNPVLAMCAGNAVVKGDEKARTLAKRSDEARIDGMVALTMAMGVAPTDPAPAFDVMAMIG